jgi:hypothetical protein
MLEVSLAAVLRAKQRLSEKRSGKFFPFFKEKQF